MASSIPAAARGGLEDVSVLLCRSLVDGFIRDENGGSGGTGLLHGIGDIGEDGKVEVERAGLLGVGTTDDVGAYAE